MKTLHRNDLKGHISKNQIKFIRQLELKKFRQREGLFVAEGPKVVGDLLDCGWKPRQLFATDAWTGQNEAIRVSDDELRKISFLQHPQQVLALFPTPHDHSEAQPSLLESHSSQRLFLALDGIQDPGNLGTIIRIADWFGIATVFCSYETADAWNPKVVQATMGSIARVKVCYVNMEELLRNTTLPVYGTLLDGDSIYGQQLSSEGIIVMGNEGNGISPSVRQLVGHRLLIPAFGRGAESLNVAIATAIVCSEFRRRQ